MRSIFLQTLFIDLRDTVLKYSADRSCFYYFPPSISFCKAWLASHDDFHFHQGFYLQVSHIMLTLAFYSLKLLWFTAIFLHSLAFRVCGMCFIPTVKLPRTSSYKIPGLFCAYTLLCRSVLLSQLSLQICLEGRHWSLKLLYSKLNFCVEQKLSSSCKRTPTDV